MRMLWPVDFDLIDESLRSQQSQSDRLRQLLQIVSGNAAAQRYLLTHVTTLDEPQGFIGAIVEMSSQGR
jgi:hypothetical protein